MKSISRNQINPIKMSVNPPDEVVNAGHRVINDTDGHIYHYVGIGWVKERKANIEDYQNIPQLID